MKFTPFILFLVICAILSIYPLYADVAPISVPTPIPDSGSSADSDTGTDIAIGVSFVVVLGAVLFFARKKIETPKKP